MDAPPPAQPDAAAPPTSSTTASAPPSAPPTNPTPSASTAAPPTSDSTPAPALTPAPAPAPVQTLEPPTSTPASARPLPPRMRAPYGNLASPIALAPSPAAAAASSSSAAVPAASAPSAVPRGAVTIGLPAQPRGAQTPVGYTGFVPPPPVSHQFGAMHRGPDQVPPSSAQLRQPSPGIQNIGMAGSLNASQMRLPAISSLQQSRPGLPSSTAPYPSGSQMIGSQKTPAHTLTRPLSCTAPPSTASPQTPSNVPPTFRPQHRPQYSQTRAYPVPQPAQPDSSSTLQASNMQLVDMASINADAGVSGRLLSKRSIHDLVSQIDPSEQLDPEVEDVLIDIAENFVESVATFACSLANHRKSSTLEAKDILLHAERGWNITLPGFGGDEIKLYKKPHVNDIHRERLTLIKKSMASEGNTKSSAAQAAANQKNQASKPPATGSP